MGTGGDEVQVASEARGRTEPGAEPEAAAAVPDGSSPAHRWALQRDDGAGQETQQRPAPCSVQGRLQQVFLNV